MRVLFVEDVPSDKELAESVLAKEGIAVTSIRVQTREEFLSALAEFHPDLILSDYSLPQFDAIQALHLAREHDPHLPFIVLTDPVNEETEVACLRAGANDYVLKANTTRLPHAVREAAAHRNDHLARLAAEDALRNSERRLRALIENGLDNISLLSSDGTLLWESPAVIRNLDYPEDEFLGRSIFELMHPDDLAWAGPRFERLIQTSGGRDTGEFRLRHRSGEWRWVESTATNLLEDPSVNAIVINYRDITPRKLAEETLREREHLLKMFVEHSPAAIAMFDRDMKYLARSRRWMIDYRIEGGEVIGRSHYEVFPELPERWKELHRRCLAGAIERSDEDPFPRADGTTDWVRWEIRPWYTGQGDIGGILIFSELITERKLAEDALKESESRLGLAVDAAYMGTFDWDIPNDRITWSRWHEELWGYRLGEFAGTYASFSERVHPEDLPGINAMVERCMATGERYAKEFRVVWPDGSIHWIQGFGEFTFGADSRPLRMRGVVQETTARKLSESLLAESRDRLLEQQKTLAGLIRSDIFSGMDVDVSLRQLLEAAARHQRVERVSLWRIVREGAAIHCIDLYEAQQDRHSSGMELEREDYPEYFKALETEDEIVADEAHSHPFTKAFSDAYLTPLGITSMLDVPIHRHGRLEGVLCCEHLGEAIHWTQEQRLFAVSFASLVTLAIEQGERRRVEEERNRLEIQLAQAQKLEAVGRLAGGVAHDFNNTLQAIMGYADLALQSLPDGTPLRHDLRAISEAARRSADLTRQLLAFARKQAINPKVVDLNVAVNNMLKMLERLIGEDIGLAWRPGSHLWRVRIDPSQLDQVLANLTVNARDAISGVGRVTIETENRVITESELSDQDELLPGDYVRLTVSDNGHGMDRETLDHVFEPFFTTKGVGEGTGLGLATVYGIVKQNDGYIQVHSEPGRGTTFRIFFPRVAAGAEEDPVPGEDSPPRGGNETVLLVEDEEAVLRLAQRILDELGYHVLVAGKPHEALALAREYSGEIHLLVTDVIMPEMNGRDLATHISSCKPGMKLVYMSGYTADVIAHRGVLDDGILFIQKPFSINALGQKVREALDQ